MPNSAKHDFKNYFKNDFDNGINDKPLAKYRARTNLWKNQRLGLHYTVHSYNSFILPTLSFVWQLEEVPDEVFAEEALCLCSLTRGPGKWRLSSDLFYLNENYGQARSFKSVKHVSLAAKLRVLTVGGLEVQSRATALRNARVATDFTDRMIKWHKWFESSYLFTLLRADAKAKGLGIDAKAVIRELRSTDATTAEQKFQGALVSRLLQPRAFNEDCDERLRHKMKRWRHLDIPLGTMCRRLSKRLKHLHRLTTLRVQAAVFRTLWNGWTTAARFQRVRPCNLGCNTSAEDRIEHYACCVFYRRLVEWMGLDNRLVSRAGFLLVAPGMSDQEITLVSVAVYAMHLATAHFRSSDPPTSSVVMDFLQQTCRSAVFGHCSTAVLEEATRYRHRSIHVDAVT